MSEYLYDKAEGLGLKIFNSDDLDKAIQKLEDLIFGTGDDEGQFDVEYDSGDTVVCCHRDEGYVSAIIDVLGVCAKFPDRRKWVLGFHDQCEYTYAHIFACDSIEEAVKRVKKEATRVRKLLRVNKIHAS